MTNYPPAVHLNQEELEAVYEISKVVAEEVDLDNALDRITNISRNVLIFDNAVVYLTEAKNGVEPFFARAIGRGKDIAHELPWGDKAAIKTIETGDIFIEEAQINPNEDRLNQHFYLSLPMQTGGHISGALVFIRFGGPSYEEKQIYLAEYITTHVSQLFEQKRLVEKIANLEADKRLAILQDDFVAMVSHELKTPLGFIKGYTTTLLRTDTSWTPETQSEFLHIIDEEADRLSELIENLLDSYRLKSGTIKIDPGPTSIHTFFEGVMNRIQTQEINIDINVDIQPNDMYFNADSKRLTQVVNNLISNASKYAPDSILTIKAKAEGDQVHITFHDTGPGIPADHIKNIFKRFYRVPERSAGVRGTGLGLYICKQIIETHKGEIWVESEIDHGTTFHILLPKTEPQQEEVKK